MYNKEKAGVQKLTIASAITLVLVTWFVVFLAYITRNFAIGSYWVVTGWWIPFLYVSLFGELLGKLDKRLRPTPLILFLALVPMWFSGGKNWFTYGGQDTFLDTIAAHFDTFAVWGPSPLSATAADVIALNPPSWLIPTDSAIVNAAFNGLAPGGAINWGAWIGPIVAWSLLMIAPAAMFFFLSFLITGPQWVEVENVAFSTGVPVIYIINSTVASSLEDGKPRLLNFSYRTTKVFWIAFAVGLAQGLIPTIWSLLMQVGGIAAISGGQGVFVGGYHLDMSWLETLIPGSAWTSTLNPGLALLWILLPYDVSLSNLIAWFAVGVVYYSLSTQLGWVPVGANKMTSAPFPWYIWAQGLMLGIGLWVLWNSRKRIVRAAQSLTGDDVVEHGMSMRNRTIGLVISIIACVVLWSAVGMPPAVAVAFLFGYVLWMIAAGKVYSEVMVWVGMTCMPVDYFYQFYFPVGAATGGWSNVPVQQSYQLYITNGLANAYGTCPGGDSPASVWGGSYSYKIATETGAPLKEILKWLMILPVIVVPFYYVLDVYYIHYAGGSTNVGGVMAWGAWQLGEAALSYGVTSAPAVPLDFNLLWNAIGAISVFAIMLLRSRFAWFILNPVGIVTGLSWWYWTWANSLVGFLIKFTLTKALGPKRTAEYIVPIVSGLLIGAGALYLVIGLTTFIYLSIPNLLALTT